MKADRSRSVRAEDGGEDDDDGADAGLVVDEAGVARDGEGERVAGGSSVCMIVVPVLRLERDRVRRVVTASNCESALCTLGG